MNVLRLLFKSLMAAVVLGTVLVPVPSWGALFPSGATDHARLEVDDPGGGLSWATNALTVSCWVKISIPSGASLAGPMTILGNRRSGDWGQPHAFRFYYNTATGNIEFSARGSSGALTPVKLVERPYLDRWYHLTMVRSGDQFTPFVDGRQLPAYSQSIGSSANTDGVVLGAMSSEQRFWGELQEVAIYQRVLNRSEILNNLFRDIPPTTNQLKGYFKLGFSTVPADNLKNFAATPPSGTGAATPAGIGAISFPETDRQGEQSLFDSRRNQGRDAILSLSGTYHWEQLVFSRATPGIPFEFSFAYSSAIGSGGQQLEGGVDVYADDTALGTGWRHSFQTRLIAGDLFSPGSTSLVGLLTWNGSLENWQRVAGGGGTFAPVHGEYRGELREVAIEGDDYVEWTTPERLVYRFYHPSAWIDPLTKGRLAEIRDFNGNRIRMGYDADTGKLASVTDASGAVWSFTYNPGGLLHTVAGLGWTATFNYDAENRLTGRSVSGPAAYTAYPDAEWNFHYNDKELLERVEDPLNITVATVNYDAYARKTSEADAMGRTTRYDYNTPGLRQLTITRNHGSEPAQDRKTVRSFDRKLRLLSETDAMGHTTSYDYDATGNTTATIDPLGVRTTMTYGPRAVMLSRTNGLGQTTRWEYQHTLSGGTAHREPTKEIRPATGEAPDGWENRYEYDGSGNLLFHRDGAVGSSTHETLAAHAYDTRGLVVSSTDANGVVTHFSYDTEGFPASRSSAWGLPEQATWTITSRSELGWPLAESNPLGEPVSRSYNVMGQVVSLTDAIGRTFTKSYDAAGNLKSESDGKGVLTLYQYNGSGQLAEKTDRGGNVWHFEYNSFGEPSVTIAPLAPSDAAPHANRTTRSYDKNGRLTTETDPYEVISATFEYDSRGHVVAVIDKAGKRLERSYDALGRLVAERDPEGNVTRTSYDAAGRIHTMVSPNGFASTHAYDGRGRLQRWTDPEGNSWIYSYDDVGNIRNIQDAMGGDYAMTYGPRNERLTETNQNGKTWIYTYDLLGRLRTQTNPIGAGAGPGGTAVVRNVSYDQAGRPKQVSFNTGRNDTLDYDDNDNPRSLTRSRPGEASVSVGLDYDALDRLTESRDTFAKTVRYSYDALGRVILKRYPGGKDLSQSYDRLGRLKSLSFAGASGSPLVCDFGYDGLNRLVSRTYPNGVTQTNTFDDTGRIKTLDYAGSASPTMALAYAYDRNGNKTGGSESGTLGWTAGNLADYDETAAYEADGKLTGRSDALSPRDFNYTYDAAGNLKSAVSADGESYELTYDEDNRTTNIVWSPVGALMDKEVSNRYDALGRRVARISDAGETRYVLDLVGGMERVLCDTDANGVIQAWYVHGPDLCFRVDKNGVLTCYHADAMGNIVRTTGPAGATRNQYAYTPYGRALQFPEAIADSGDPYRFVGSQGVMLEFPEIEGSQLYFMRARYYSADAAVFLATDPVKNIGPRWKPDAYGYSYSNPSVYMDADGRMGQVAAAAIVGFIVYKFIKEYREDDGVDKFELNPSDLPKALNPATSELWISTETMEAFADMAADAIRREQSLTEQQRRERDEARKLKASNYVDRMFSPINNINLRLPDNGMMNANIQFFQSDPVATAEKLNDQQLAQPRPATSSRYDELTALIFKWQNKMDAIDERIDRLRDKIKKQQKQGNDVSKLKKQLSDLKDDWKDALKQRNEYREERKKLR